MDPPSPWLRVLYSFGVVDRTDVAFMMGNINIIGEHLANQIFHKINHVAKDETVRKILHLIGKDESRHIGAGQRFFPEVYPEFKKRRAQIMAKNVATTIILACASYDLVNPMRALDIDLSVVMDAMYQHYADVTSGLPPFPEQGLRDAILGFVRRGTPRVIKTLEQSTNENGGIELQRFLAACEAAVKSPRALRDLLAA
jgi:hypothetical protein